MHSPTSLTNDAAYDVIIVGARPAGASTAMLLAHAGLRVLVLDRSAFGADALSTHAILRGGVASTIGAVFEDGRTVDSFATEMFIRNGVISHAGHAGFFTAEGRVGDRGRLEVSIGALGMTASADGQLSERQGSGTWQFPERGCSGRWLAERRSA